MPIENLDSPYFVDSCLRVAEQKTWNVIDKGACRSALTGRILAVPLFIEKTVISLLKNPLTAMEELVYACDALFHAVSRNRKENLKASGRHLWICLIKLASTPVVFAKDFYRQAVVCAKLVYSPLKTAKIQRAKADLVAATADALFFTPIRIQLIEGFLNRFVQQVEQANVNSLRNLSLIPDKTLFLKDLHQRITLYGLARNKKIEALKVDANKAKIENAWNQFVATLITAEAKDVATVKLDIEPPPPKGPSRKERKVTWLSGGCSSACPLILHVRPGNHFAPNLPALVSTMWLLNHFKAPLTGELSYYADTISGVVLEGAAIALQYTDKGFAFDPDKEIQAIYGNVPANSKFDPIRLKISIMRLILTGSKKERWSELNAHLQTQVLPMLVRSQASNRWLNNTRLVDVQVSPECQKKQRAYFERGDLVGIKSIKDNVERFYMVLEHNRNDNTYHVVYNREGHSGWVKAEEITFYEQHTISALPPLDVRRYEEQLPEHFKYAKYSHYHHLSTLFTQVQPLDLSVDELECINNPFPVIWGSTTLQGKPVYTQESQTGLPGERVLDKPAWIGQDIQYVFVPKEKIPLVKRLFDRWNIEVLDIAYVEAHANAV
jgi:hypothetical protein